MAQFIIATNNAGVDKRNAITNFVKSKQWGFWHHFEDFWMITTNEPDQTTSQQIYEELTAKPEIGKEIFIIVIRMAKTGHPMTHFGFGPPQGWEWTSKYWGVVG